MNSKIKTFIIISVFLAMLATLSQAEVIKIGTDAGFPPYTYTDPQGNITGFEIDLGMAICKELKIECVFVKYPYGELFPALKDKKIDVIMSGSAFTEERLASFSTTEAYIQSGGSRLLKLKSGDFDFSSLKGKTVGVSIDTTSQKYLTDNYADQLIIKPFATTQDSIKALLNNEIDLIFDNEATLNASFDVEKSGSLFSFIGPRIDNPKWFGIGRGAMFNKENTALMMKFSTTIKKLRTRREFQRISQKYFHKDIYNG